MDLMQLIYKLMGQKNWSLAHTMDMVLYCLGEDNFYLVQDDEIQAMVEGMLDGSIQASAY